MDPDRLIVFKTIGKESRAEVRVGDSTFIATVYPITDRVQAEGRLKEVQDEFHNATHNLFASRLGPEGDIELGKVIYLHYI